MKKQLEKKINLKDILPSLGIVIFIILYAYATTLYPGGSQADLHSKGFDWINNYWCNLMNAQAMNGQLNPARLISIPAMIILCFSLLSFFFMFSKVLASNSIWRKIIQISGTISMLFASLIFTELHDLLTTISSLFGLFTLIGIILGLAKSNLTMYKLTGGICVLFLAFNNYIYYSKVFLSALPLLQKVTFAIFLLWIAGLNWEMSHDRKIEA